MNDEERARERELARALGVEKKCKVCGGWGYTPHDIAVCCGRRSKSGECCGEPEMVEEQEQCEPCEGTGEETVE